MYGARFGLDLIKLYHDSCIGRPFKLELQHPMRQDHTLAIVGKVLETRCTACRLCLDGCHCSGARQLDNYEARVDWANEAVARTSTRHRSRAWRWSSAAQLQRVVKHGILLKQQPARGKARRNPWQRRYVILTGTILPSTTFPVMIRCLIQIAYNMGDVVKTDKVVRSNGGINRGH